MKSRRLQWLSLPAAVLLLSLAGPVTATRVDGLYAAAVPVANASAEATQAAFAEALRRVLVKVTGQASVAQDPGVIERLGDPAAMVQQYRRDASGNLWAQFDAVTLRRKLEGMGLPVWGDDRPVTVIWLVYDTASGSREVVTSTGPADPVAATLRRDVLGAANARGTPVVLPLGDTQDLAVMGNADALLEPGSAGVVRASARYRADAVLVGRAQAPSAPVRWTLMLGNERIEWTGGVADGPQGLADRLAQRLAATAAPAVAGALRLGVTGIGSFAQYGQALAYLRSLDMIESLDLSRVAGEWFVFEMRLRGDREQLTRALAARRVMEPEAAMTADLPAGAALDLTYRLSSAP